MNYMSIRANLNPARFKNQFLRTPLFENLIAFHIVLTQGFLFFDRQVDRVLAFPGAAIFIVLPAGITLDEEQVTAVVHTIRVVIKSLPALMTLSYHIV